MNDTSAFPVSDDEIRRLRLLASSGFANHLRIHALDDLCAEARTVFGVDFVTLSLLTEDLQILKARVGIEAATTPRHLAFCNYTILDDAIFVVTDTLTDSRFADHPMVTGDPKIRFYAGAPLIYVNGIRLGAFCLLDRAPRLNFSADDKAELAEFAEMAVQVLIGQLRSTG
jgi:GAF domain-containing protein